MSRSRSYNNYSGYNPRRWYIPTNVIRPVREPTTPTDVGVPLRQAFLTATLRGLRWGVLIAGTGFILDKLTSWTIDTFSFDIVLPITQAGIILGIITFICLTTFYLYSDWQSSLDNARDTIYSLELVTGQDINHDGVVGKPSTRYVTVRGINTKSNSYTPDNNLIGFVQEAFPDKLGVDYWERRGVRREQRAQYIRAISDYLEPKGKPPKPGAEPPLRFLRQFKNANEVVSSMFPDELNANL